LTIRIRRDIIYIIKKLTKNFNRSSDMNLTFLTKTDKELFAMRFQQDSDGKLARKEITRRKLVGYCDGTNIQKVDAKAPIVEPESTVGTSPDRVYAAGVRRTR
jgi:hypothetical protein